MASSGVLPRALAPAAVSRDMGAWIAVALVLLLATVPAWSGSSFTLSRYVIALCYVMAALGMNLALGYAGEFVLGHPVVMGTAAYASGMLSAHAGWPFSLTLPAGVLAGIAAGVIIMSPGLRVRGWYYSLITMFAVLVLPPLILMAERWTGGADGLTGIKGMTVFGQPVPDWALFEIALGFTALAWWLVDNFVRSGWGHRLRALRDARQAAEASGIDLTRTRLVVYVLSSLPAAVAGVLLTYANKFVGVDMFGMNLMLLFLTGVVLGGPGTRWGPVLGMVPLLFLSFWVGPFSPYNAVGLGVGLLVGTLLFPNGVMPGLQARWSARCPAMPVPAEASGTTAALVDPRGESRGTSAGSDILAVQGVWKSFGGNLALSGVDLAMRRGSLIGLVGPNGSGKSTLLNAISGFLRPDAGVIHIDGRATGGLPVHCVARHGVGRTFQVPQLVDEFDALRNIEVGLVAAEPRAILGALLRTSATHRRDALRAQRALAAFRLVGLPEHALHQPVASLPLGLKRIVEIARAIVSGPQLLLLDEPGAGLNDEERRKLGQLLQKLSGLGVSVLVVEHNVPFLLEFCEELVLLEAGSVSCAASVGQPLPQRLLDYLNLKIAT